MSQIHAKKGAQVMAITKRATVSTLIMAGVFAAAGAMAGPSASSHHHHGHHDHAMTDFGEPGDPKRKSRVIDIIMKEADGKMLFEPSQLRITQGEQIMFRLKNIGALKHEMVIGTLEANLAHAEEMKKNPDMEHDDPNAKELEPGTSSTLLWRFTKAGRFDFSCLIPGHREAGMSGEIIVSRRK